jgi:hypothetical protein
MAPNLLVRGRDHTTNHLKRKLATESVALARGPAGDLEVGLEQSVVAEGTAGEWNAHQREMLRWKVSKRWNSCPASSHEKP